MGIQIRQPKDKLARGDKAWWIFVNHRGKRFSQKCGSLRTAMLCAREWEEVLKTYDVRIRFKKEVP
jgi:hypothetical protein